MVREDDDAARADQKYKFPRAPDMIKHHLILSKPSTGTTLSTTTLLALSSDVSSYPDVFSARTQVAIAAAELHISDVELS